MADGFFRREAVPASTSRASPTQRRTKNSAAAGLGVRHWAPSVRPRGCSCAAREQQPRDDMKRSGCFQPRRILFFVQRQATRPSNSPNRPSLWAVTLFVPSSNVPGSTWMCRRSDAWLDAVEHCTAHHGPRGLCACEMSATMARIFTALGTRLQSGFWGRRPQSVERRGTSYCR